MSYTDWKIETKRLVSCSCDYGCPCEFNGRPTQEFCEGVEAMEIVEGYFGDVRLDGLRVAGIYRWPGPVHEGGGIYQAIIDDRATESQKEALLTILSGQEQEPTTAFSIYASTIDEEPDPIFAPIEFEWNLQNRTGRMAVSGVFAAALEPIRNPMTGKLHLAAIELPHGFEFRKAEMASSTFHSTGEVIQNHQNRYGCLTYATYDPYGVVEGLSYPQAGG
ncbi:MAG TPA: DUF1326 domain-containing protein [Oscillatoriales cyanobacterium M59_W2019_021]|nr:DUF1326 domain-containing protein [Oscillatoriales cyanobacterium M4454_W2019_049]HIK52654.1 DUF1326 domain-containing protein [Oscillatoriales cyanobacterium M59_W2019_021]